MPDIPSTLVVVHANAHRLSGDVSRALEGRLNDAVALFPQGRVYDLVGNHPTFTSSPRPLESYLSRGTQVPAYGAFVERERLREILSSSPTIYLAGGKFAYPQERLANGCHHHVFEQLLVAALEPSSPASSSTIVLPGALLYVQDPEDRLLPKTIPVSDTPLARRDPRGLFIHYWASCDAIARDYGCTVTYTRTERATIRAPRGNEMRVVAQAASGL